MRLPTLGVMVGLHPPPALRALLLAATDRCSPVACSAIEAPPTPAPAAYLWCGGSARPPQAAPYAAWAHRPVDLDHPVARDARVLLCDTLAAAECAGARGVFVPSTVADPQTRPLSPFVRRRLRQARGLPRTVTVRGEEDRWYWGACPDPLPPELAGTALGCASAVVAGTGQALVSALAWAAPTVTDPAAAAELGARDSEHVLIGTGPEVRLALAQELATDEARAARLGWSGWLLARERADIRHSAVTMIRRLGLPPQPLAGPLGRVDDELDNLGTPADSLARTRARALLAPLPGVLPGPLPGPLPPERGR